MTSLWLKKRKRLKRRKGFSLLETMASVVLISLGFLAVGYIGNSKLDASSKIDAQYSMVAVDAYLSDIYHSFHECTSLDFTEAPSGQKILSFTRMNGNAVIYSYNPSDNGCYKNGVRQFAASSFDVTKTTNSLSVVISLPGDRIFDIHIYR